MSPEAVSKILSTLLIISFSLSNNAQSKFPNTGFEPCNTTGKHVCVFNYRCYKSDIFLDSLVFFAEKNSLCINSRNRNREEGCTVYAILPKHFCNNLKQINISVRIRFPYDRQNGGFWIFSFKDNKIINGASTYPYKLPFPLILTHIYQGALIPVTAWKWNIYEMEFTFTEDPEEIMFGFYTAKGRIWFDDIKITLNDGPVENIIFQME